MNIFVILTICANLTIVVVNSAVSKEWKEELFGEGLSAKTLAEKSRKHLASSTEDLLILLDMEQNVLQKVKNSSQMSETFKNYVISLEFLSDKEFDPEKYIFHPINAFHLMKRASKVWPKIRKALSESNNESGQDIIFPEKSDFMMGASFGLVNLQVMHQLNVSEMIRGVLRDPFSDKTFHAHHNLTSEDAMFMATSAKTIARYNSQVLWLEGALEAALMEKKSEKEISKIRKTVFKAKKYHDDLIYNKGFLRTTEEYEIVFTNNKTFDEKLMDTPNLKIHLASLEEFGQEMKPFKNLTGTDLPFKLGYFTDKLNQELCMGKEMRPPELDKGLKCSFLHYQNPFLRLGPFKYEPKNLVPHVGMFHDFASKSELHRIRQKARGHMKSTPLRTNNNLEDYTRHRTSKVMYQNEKSYDNAKKMSNRIDLATKFRTYKEKFASENYQVMNYGIGGSIVGHLDSTGEKKDINHQEDPAYGGPRFCTFMIYLSSLEAGGRTVFPLAGLSVPPKEGSALFWFNLDSAGFLDTRNYHLGCPVLYGNKWIANKWVHWHAQMHEYPCYVKTKAYPIYTN